MNSPTLRTTRVARAGYLLALASTLLGATCNAQPVTVHVTRAQILEVPTTGFSPPPYSIASGAFEGNWVETTLPHAPRPQILTREAKSSADQVATVVTWYRIQVRGLEKALTPYYLYIPRWKTDGTITVYADSRLVYQSHANLLWNGSNNPLWISLDETADARAPREILVRIQHLQGTGGALSSIWVGPHDALAWRYRTRAWFQNQLPFMSSAAFLAVGIFALFVWFQRRHERLYLLLPSISVLSYIRTLHNYVGMQRLPISDEWFGWLTVNSMFWLVAVTHLFLARLHQRSRLWLSCLVVGLTVANSLLTLPVFAANPSATLLAPASYITLLIVAAMAFGIGLRSSWIARSHDGRILATWCVVSLLGGVYDWSLGVNLVNIEGAFLVPYADIGGFFIFTYILYRRYVGAIRDVEQVNDSLAQRLAAREAELAASYEHLREVEHRQMLSQERQRLMQDMHDGLGSSLVSALRVVEGGRISEREVAQVLKGCIDDLKLAIDSMEPVEADLLLLLATLRYRLESRLESGGIHLRWEISDVPPLDWLEPRSSLHILRILQEAFTNIIKHTGATEIRVGTAVESERLLVTLADNGPGFDLNEALKRGGKGLANQLRRAEAIGAELRWISSATGTCLTLSLPIERQCTAETNASEL